MGLLFACHGAQKLFGVLGGRIAINSPLRLSAGLIELVAGTLVDGWLLWESRSIPC